MESADAHGLGIRVRRGRRADTDAVRVLVGRVSDDGRTRFDRRTVGGLADDVYVAQDAEGIVRGVVVVGYVRSLGTGRFAAIVDGVWVAPGWDAAVAPLVACVHRRARGRGCGRIVVDVDVVSPAVRAVFEAQGYVGHAVLVGPLSAST